MFRIDKSNPSAEKPEKGNIGFIIDKFYVL